MRSILMLFAFLVVAIAPAQATENRMTVTEIHNFIGQANSAINNPNWDVSRSFLNRTTAENAVFENRVSVYNNYAHPYHRVWHNNPYYGSYYRYPMNPYYAPTSMRAAKKHDHINMLASKKRMIPGYHAHMDITDTTINPYGSSAVIDIDMKEYSLSYTPLHPTLATRVLHANSKCKMYLTKMGQNELILTRMDCNTNTNLPF